MSVGLYDLIVVASMDLYARLNMGVISDLYASVANARLLHTRMQIIFIFGSYMCMDYVLECYMDTI